MAYSTQSVYSSLKTGFRTALTASDVTDLEGVGTLRFEGECVYRYVKFLEALSAGDIAFFDAGNAATKLLHEVRQCDTEDLPLMAGVVIVDQAADDYGWILVEGVHDETIVFVSTTTSIAIGDSLIGSDGQDHAALGAAAGTAPLYKNQLIALAAQSMGGSPATTAMPTLVKCL